MSSPHLATFRHDRLPPDRFRHPSYRPRIEVNGESLWYLQALPDLIASWSELLERARRPLAPRAGLGAALDALHADWRLERAGPVDAGIRALADGASCVVTGQQPGFLGGPAYTLYKAVSAIAIARRVTHESGAPCVPVFWVASEDHDIDEVRSARLSADEDDVVSLEHPAERRPLGEVIVGERAVETARNAIDRLRAEAHGGLVAELADAYLDPSRSVASAFAALVHRTLGRHGLVVVEPESLRPLGVEIVRRVIESPARALEAIEAGASSLEARGVRRFVTARLPLFRIADDGTRDHLSPADQDTLAVDGGGPRFTREALLEELASEPRRFSSGALLRPLVQEHIFSPVATVGGPAEIGYFAQLAPLAEHLGVSAPSIVPRLSATLLSGRTLRSWQRLELDRDLARFARATAPEELLPPSAEPAEIAALRELLASLEITAPRLADALPGSRQSLERGATSAVTALRKLLDRSISAHARAREDLFPAAQRLFADAYPGGAPQERRIAWLAFIARFGLDLVTSLVETATESPTDLAHDLFRIEES